MKVRAVLLTVGTIILLIVRIFAESIGLFSPMWWAWILAQVFMAGAAGFCTALALVHCKVLGGNRGSNSSTFD